MCGAGELSSRDSVAERHCGRPQPHPVGDGLCAAIEPHEHPDGLPVSRAMTPICSSAGARLPLILSFAWRQAARAQRLDGSAANEAPTHRVFTTRLKVARQCLLLPTGDAQMSSNEAMLNQ